MNRSIEEICLAVPGVAARELLKELDRIDWIVPTTKAVDNLDVAIGIHPGTQRARNEDRAAVAQVKSLCGQCFSIALVCDGVGGSESGDMAAMIAVATCIGGLAELKSPTAVVDVLPRIIRGMDDSVRRALDGRGATTASIVLGSSKGDFAAANVGDSRLFAWAHNEKQLRQVSVDDTLENELKNVPGADISALNARGLQGSLSQALGEAGRGSADLHIVVFGRNQFGEGAVLASDGAWKAAEDGFNAIVRNAPSASDLVRRVITTAAWAGGIDNVSIVAIRDIDRFLDLAFRMYGREPANNRITVWSSNLKLVLIDVFDRFADPVARAKQPVMQRDPDPSTGKRDKRKALTAGKRRRAVVKSVPNAQLELKVEGEEKKEKEGAESKPKIVISTDDDSHKPE